MNNLGIFVDGLGTIAVGWMALSVHRVVGEEHRIDRRVVGLMRRERTSGFLGLLLVALGTALQALAR